MNQSAHSDRSAPTNQSGGVNKTPIGRLPADPFALPLQHLLLYDSAMRRRVWRSRPESDDQPGGSTAVPRTHDGPRRHSTLVHKCIYVSVFAMAAAALLLARWSGRRSKGRASGRFPRYGTSDFDAMCNWTLPHRTWHNNNNECHVLARPRPDNIEGISQWTSQIVSGYILAKQTGCRLLLDYGEGIDVGSVLGIVSKEGNDWAVPSGFVCRDRCVTAPTMELSGRYLDEAVSKLRDDAAADGSKANAAPIPWYRFAYMMTFRENFARNWYDNEEIRLALPGFAIETGMACALGATLELSGAAARYEPLLFRKILPALRSPDALVLGVYIRTGEADRRRDYDYERVDLRDAKEWSQLDCALQLERRHLGSLEENAVRPRILWVVSTDSLELKKLIVATFDTTSTVNDEISREIIVTSFKGAHTKTKLDPSTSDFAGAMIDWYLLGESDAVIFSNAYTFGVTAAFRTARPIYDGRTCTLNPLFLPQYLG